MTTLIQVQVGDQHRLWSRGACTSTRPHGSEMNDEPFVLGSALDLTAPEEPWGSGPEVGPELAAALNTAAGDPTRADDAFEFGLAALLRGLSAFPASVAPGPA